MGIDGTELDGYILDLMENWGEGRAHMSYLMRVAEDDYPGISEGQIKTSLNRLVGEGEIRVSRQKAHDGGTVWEIALPEPGEFIERVALKLSPLGLDGLKSMGRHRECVDYDIALLNKWLPHMPTNEKTREEAEQRDLLTFTHRLTFRHFKDRTTPDGEYPWMCFLELYGRCYAQTSFSDFPEDWFSTPQAAYQDLINEWQKTLDQDLQVMASLREAADG